MTEIFSLKRAFGMCRQGWKLYRKDALNYGFMILLGMIAAAASGCLLIGPMAKGILSSVRSLQKDIKVGPGDAFNDFKRFGDSVLAAIFAFLLSSVVFTILGGGGLLIGFFIENQILRYILLAVILVIAGFCFIISAAVIPILLLLPLSLVAEQGLSAREAWKRFLKWVKADYIRAIECALSCFFCNFAFLIPLIGPSIAVGLLSIVNVLYFDELIAAGDL